jgi:hypothetical protein
MIGFAPLLLLEKVLRPQAVARRLATGAVKGGAGSSS